MANLPVTGVLVRARPLDRPEPADCTEHDSCRVLAQHYMLTLEVHGEETPVTTLTVEAHA